MNLTYGQLADALTILGFDMAEANNALVFHEHEHDAVLVLPKVQSNECVRPAHLIAARHTVIGKGVAGLDAFDSALETARDRSNMPHHLDGAHV